MTLYNKNNIYDVAINNYEVEFLYRGTCQEAANLRNFIREKIYFYLIHRVIFYKNTSNKNFEFLSSRFGQLVLDNANIKNDDVGTLNVTGPLMVTANHIKGLTFVYDSPIVYLKEGEVLECNLEIDKNCGATHKKWNPVACITFTDYDKDVFKFKFELIGSITMDDIMQQL